MKKSKAIETIERIKLGESKDFPKDLSKDFPKDLSKDLSKDFPKDLSKDLSKEAKGKTFYRALKDVVSPKTWANTLNLRRIQKPGKASTEKLRKIVRKLKKRNPDFDWDDPDKVRKLLERDVSFRRIAGGVGKAVTPVAVAGGVGTLGTVGIKELQSK